MRLMTARDQRPSLRFVEGINVELTYGCQLDCPHCLQADQRARGETAWADPEPIRRALIEALDLGLIRTGINFTGGEILRAGSPLPALLETTRALGVPVRLNTNGWWGRARRFLVGKLRFDSAEVLIGWLQAMGVAVLALSIDERYGRYPGLWSSNVAIVRRCERLRQPYELIFTGLTGDRIDAWRRRLADETATDLGMMAIRDMERVDIGAAAGRLDRGTEDDRQPLARLRQTDCALRGFYRPAFLHLAPDGGVRSCLYAVGAGWLGNIRTQSLRAIAEGFSGNPVTACFSGANFERTVTQVLPTQSEPARRLRHPCGLAATLARRIACDRLRSSAITGYSGDRRQRHGQAGDGTNGG